MARRRARPAIACVLLALSASGVASPLGGTADAVRAELRARLPKPPAALATVSGDAQTQAVLARGHEIWTRRFANGRSLAGCFPNGGIRLATAHPRFDRALGVVITLEMAVNQCLKAHREPLLDPSDPQSMGALTAYIRYLAAGQRLSIRVDSDDAQVAFASGRAFFFDPRGPSQRACADCHAPIAAQPVLGETPPPSALTLATSWPTLKDGSARTLQMQARECLEKRLQAEMPAVDSAALAHLDYFLSYLANGDPIAPSPPAP